MIKTAIMQRGRGGVRTIDKMTTHGKFKSLTRRAATDVLPEPDEPAIPMI